MLRFQFWRETRLTPKSFANLGLDDVQLMSAHFDVLSERFGASGLSGCSSKSEDWDCARTCFARDKAATHGTAGVYINDAEDSLLQDYGDWPEKLNSRRTGQGRNTVTTASVRTTPTRTSSARS